MIRLKIKKHCKNIYANAVIVPLRKWNDDTASIGIAVTLACKMTSNNLLKNR